MFVIFDKCFAELCINLFTVCRLVSVSSDFRMLVSTNFLKQTKVLASDDFTKNC